MDKLLETIQEMRRTRGWDNSDTLPILIKSVSVEAAELLETIQWDEQNIDMEAVKGELADVLMYALSICIDMDWDVLDLIEEKIKNVSQILFKLEQKKLHIIQTALNCLLDLQMIHLQLLIIKMIYKPNIQVVLYCIFI